MTCRAPGAIRPAPAHADGGGKAAASEHPTDSLTKAITARASGPMTRRGTVSPCRTCLCGLCVCVELCDPAGEPGKSWTSRRKPFVYYSVRVYNLLVLHRDHSVRVLSFAARSRVFYYDKMKLVTPHRRKRRWSPGEVFANGRKMYYGRLLHTGRAQKSPGDQFLFSPVSWVTPGCHV